MRTRDVSQASVLGSGGVPHERVPPGPSGYGADARDLTALGWRTSCMTQDQPR